MDLKRLRENYVEYPDLDCTRNYFLAACRYYQPDLDANSVLQECPDGGTIGIGDSKLHNVLGRWKIFRLHAIFHDAAGYVYVRWGVGPGYCYMFKKFPINSCFLGHVSGLAYCVYLKLCDKRYSSIDC